MVSYHERKLVKHVKGVREKKTKRGKVRTFHRLSSSITSTLTSQPCTTLSPITRSTRNGKYKGGRRRTTNLEYPTLQHEKKTTLLSGYLPIQNTKGVFIGTRRTGARGKPWPEVLAKRRQYNHGNAAKVAFSWLY